MWPLEYSAEGNPGPAAQRRSPGGSIIFNIFFWFLLGSWFVIRWILSRFGYSDYLVYQMENLRPRGRYIRELDTKEHRLKLLHAVEKLYVLYGTRDTIVDQGAFFDRLGIDGQLLREKHQEIPFEGATHWGTLGLSQDPRVILRILEILCGQQLSDRGGLAAGVSSFPPGEQQDRIYA